MQNKRAFRKGFGFLIPRVKVFKVTWKTVDEKVRTSFACLHSRLKQRNCYVARHDLSLFNHPVDG